jgi:hypothetical protein
MTRTTTEAAIVGGPSIASTRDYWVLHLKSEHRAERTISTYLNALRRLDEFLADRGMPRAALHPPRAPGGMDRRMLERNQAGTMSIAFRSVRPFFRWLVDEDEIDRSPMDKMHTPTPPMNPPAIGHRGLGWQPPCQRAYRPGRLLCTRREPAATIPPGRSRSRFPPGADRLGTARRWSKLHRLCQTAPESACIRREGCQQVSDDRLKGR